MGPSPLARPPDIDPRQYAVESRSWGDEFTLHVVHYDGKWFTWVIGPRAESAEVYERPDEAAARDLMVAEMARLLILTIHGDQVASVGIVDEDNRRMLFTAELKDGGEDGIWLATSTADGDGERYELAEFSGLDVAVEAYAARACQAADSITGQGPFWTALAGSYLRYNAALARASAARAELGDLIRRSHGQMRAVRQVGRVAYAAGISREFLYRILDGSEWTWKGAMSMRRNASPAPESREDGTQSETRVEYHETWTAVIQMKVEASDKMEALVIEDGVLGGSDLPFLGQTTVRPSGDGLWLVAEDLRLDDVPSFEPDDAQTRLRYLMGLLPSVPWSVGDGERRASARWQPDVWDQATPDEYLHPAIRGVRVIVSLG